MEYCDVCCKSLVKSNHAVNYNGVEFVSKHWSKVCSSLCQQSFQYTVGFAHGFIFLNVLNCLCGHLPGEILTSSPCRIQGVNRNSVQQGSPINEFNEASLKAETDDDPHLEDDITDGKVFFDGGDCSESEGDPSEDLSVEPSHEKCKTVLHTPLHFSKVAPQYKNHHAQLENKTSAAQSTGSSKAATAVLPDKIVIQCQFCHSTFPSGHYQALAEHFCEIHTKHIHLICEVCGNMFDDRKILRQHKNNVHCKDIIAFEKTWTRSLELDKCSGDRLVSGYSQQHGQRSQSIYKPTQKGDLSGQTVKNVVHLNQPRKSKQKEDIEESGEKTRYWCHTCNKEYPTKVRLQRHHQFVHSKQTAAPCTVCGKSFRNKLLLKHHVQFLHSKQTSQDCQVCGKTYRNSHLLKMHLKMVHKVKVIKVDTQESALQCTYCMHSFPAGTAGTIASHMTEHHAKEVFPSEHYNCSLCNIQFKKKVYLTRHQKKAHSFDGKVNSESEGKVKSENDNKRYPCDKCGKTYTQSALSKHFRIYHSKQEPVDCEVCGKTLINSFHLEQHKRQHMPSKICDICGANFKTDAGLRGHLAAHKGTKSHICEVCGVSFVRKTSWQRHVKLHTETVLNQCEDCPKTFKTVYSLNMHVLSKHQRGVFFNNRLKTLEQVGYAVDIEAVSRHLSHRCTVCGEAMESGLCLKHPDDCKLLFRCNFCELVLTHIDNLCQHLKQQHNIPLAFTASTGNFTVAWSAKRDDSDRSFTCQVCQKSFKRREILTGHMKQHKEKAFSCQICHRKFTYKCNMKNHLRTHSEEKPFKCELCNKSFKSKQLLNNHRLVHNLTNSPFKCQVCGKGLTRKYFLRRHYQQMHPDVAV